MSRVKSIFAREILDSRGVPTIQGHLTTDDGCSVTTEISSGKSLSKFEPKELRDENKNRYYGKGVLKAISYINTLLGPKLAGVDVGRISDVDYWLIRADGTPDKSKLGTNTIMTISQLFLKAAAKTSKMSSCVYINSYYNRLFKTKLSLEKIPAPIINIINGGIHGSKTLDFQEFHIMPSTSFNYSKSLEIAVHIYEITKDVLEHKNVGIFLSDQGGYSPNLANNVDALEVLKEAIEREKMQLGVEIFMGLDCASTFFYKDKRYTIKDKPESLQDEKYIKYLTEIAKNYSILFIEDPLEENNFTSWQLFTKNVGDTIFIAGDDLISGNPKRLKKAIEKKSCNTVVIKFNQYSTITEILEAVYSLKKEKIKTVFSQRLGETNDALIADLAVGLQSDFVKFGSPNRGERVAKYNRLLEIESELQIK